MERVMYNDTTFITTLLGESEDQISKDLCSIVQLGEVKVIASREDGIFKMIYELDKVPVSEETLKNELFRLFKIICKSQVFRNTQHIEEFKTDAFKTEGDFKWV